MDSITIRLHHHANDDINTAFARSTMREAKDEITRLRADLAASQAECERLKGELRVIADVMDDAAKVIHTVEGDDYDEDAALRRLVEKLFNLSTRILLQTLDAAIAGKGGA